MYHSVGSIYIVVVLVYLYYIISMIYDYSRGSIYIVIVSIAFI